MLWEGIGSQASLEMKYAGLQLTDSPAILANACIHNDRPNLVIICDCALQRLDHQNAYTLATRESGLGTVIKGKCHALIRE